MDNIRLLAEIQRRLKDKRSKKVLVQIFGGSSVSGEIIEVDTVNGYTEMEISRGVGTERILVNTSSITTVHLLDWKPDAGA